MKCDELRIENACVYGPDAKVYLAKQVDEAIEELQAENAELKQKLENVQASMYADVVDANMENRRLRRALYKACANWALSTLAWLDCIDQGEPRKWYEMQQKCLKKVEEYK